MMRFGNEDVGRAITEVMNDKRNWEEGIFQCSDFLSLFLYL